MGISLLCKSPKVYIQKCLFMQRNTVKRKQVNVQRLAPDGGGESLNVEPQASES